LSIDPRSSFPESIVISHVRDADSVGASGDKRVPVSNPILCAQSDPPRISKAVWRLEYSSVQGVSIGDDGASRLSVTVGRPETIVNKYVPKLVTDSSPKVAVLKINRVGMDRGN
jgi:hypothetical protein